MKLLPAIGLTIGGLYILSKITAVGAASRLNFVITNVNVTTSGISVILQVTVQVQNPTNSGFTINSLVGNVLLNGTLIGNASSFNQVSIAPNQQTPLMLTVVLSAIATVNDIVNILSGSSGVHAVVAINGTANVDNLPIPVNLQYQVL